MSSPFIVKPPVIRPRYDHPILRGQTCWVVAGENRSTAPTDALVRNLAAYSLGTGVSYGTSAYGAGYLCNGTSTGYVNLGSSNRFLPANSTPCTIGWIERFTGASANAAVLGIIPGSGSQFMVMRGQDPLIGASTAYGSISFGPWAASGKLVGAVATDGCPNLNASVGVTNVFLITASNGVVSQSLGYNLYVNGRNVTLLGSGNTANIGAAANYFGWDNADTKWTGVLDNLRIWTRVLSASEIAQYQTDPYVGCVRAPKQYLVKSLAGVRRPAVFTAN